MCDKSWTCKLIQTFRKTANKQTPREKRENNGAAKNVKKKYFIHVSNWIFPIFLIFLWSCYHHQADEEKLLLSRSRSEHTACPPPPAEAMLRKWTHE